jgi:hypothetical protein
VLILRGFKKISTDNLSPLFNTPVLCKPFDTSGTEPTFRRVGRLDILDAYAWEENAMAGKKIDKPKTKAAMEIDFLNFRGRKKQLLINIQ